MGRIEIPVEGMTCEHCVRTVTSALQSVKGVRSATVSLADRKAVVESDDGSVSVNRLADAVARAGYRVPARPKPRDSDPGIAVYELAKPAVEPTAAPSEVVLNVDGMTCASCVARVENALKAVPGVKGARANLATNQAAVELGPTSVPTPALIAAVESAGYQATLVEGTASAASLADRGARELAKWRRLLDWSAALLVPIVALDFAAPRWPEAVWIQLACATVLQFYVGWPYYVGAYRRLRHLSTNMDTLVTIGTLAAYGSGVYSAIAPAHHEGYSHQMHLMDAGIILTFITLGKYLEARAKGRASEAIRKLLDLVPPQASVERNGRIEIVSPETVAVGETIVVPPGEKVPLDAEFTAGTSSVDESWLTG